MEFYRKKEEERIDQHERSIARRVLLDPKLKKLYMDDPFIHAALRPYIYGEKNLEECLIVVIAKLIENRNEMLTNMQLSTFIPSIMPAGVLCKGSKALGTACGRCERCLKGES